MQQQEKSIGLGDTIEKITTVTGIKKIVDNVAKVTGKGVADLVGRRR